MLSYGWGVCEWEGSHTSRQEEGEEEGAGRKKVRRREAVWCMW